MKAALIQASSSSQLPRQPRQRTHRPMGWPPARDLRARGSCPGGTPLLSQGSPEIRPERTRATMSAGPEWTASSLPACCPGNLAPRKVPPGEDPVLLRLAVGKSGIPGRVPDPSMEVGSCPASRTGIGCTM